MQPTIQTLTEKKLIGKKLVMSFANNKTAELWRSFMPQRHAIKNAIGTELYSLEVYPSTFFDQYDPANDFEKWAAVEVTDFEHVPAGMEIITLPGGLYAVFVHKGTTSKGHLTYQYIFTQWLPAADFILDNRPHFAIMGEKYKPMDEDSEEEIWIPVKSKYS